MSDFRPVNMTPSGPPSTVLAPEPIERQHGLRQALALSTVDERRTALGVLVTSSPRFVEGWARLGENARDEIEAYAYFRVGYHRGLDLLRANGWRGSGYVRWASESNRGFLRALRGLRDAAAAIGEHDEAERCAHFLRQLDPDWPAA